MGGFFLKKLSVGQIPKRIVESRVDPTQIDEPVNSEKKTFFKAEPTLCFFLFFFFGMGFRHTLQCS